MKKWLFKPLLVCLLLGAWIAPGYALTSSEAEELSSKAKGGDAQALKALEQAAAQGDAEAQSNLGFMYIVGQGVQQDYAQARRWWEKAAAQGHAEALFFLGAVYYDGKGVRQDDQVAKEWFGKACDAGYQLGCNAYRNLNAPLPMLKDPILVDNTQPPVYIELPPYVTNLDPAEGERYVQANIVLQVATDPKYSAMIEGSKPLINHSINRILASKKPSVIRTTTGQEALSQEILAAVNDALGYPKPAQPTGPWGPVIAVLFTSLIIQ